MSDIKKLAGQTLWYGVSNVGAKMLNFLLTPLLTYLLNDQKGMVDYGNMSVLYAWIAVANIVFTYGMETAYFRFSNQEGVKRNILFNTSFSSVLLSTSLLTFLLISLSKPIQAFLQLNNHSEYIVWCAWLIALDTLSAIPFAKLRQENKPRKYAFIKLAGILINIFFVIVLIVYAPHWANEHSNTSLAGWIKSKDRLGFILLANLLQNLFVFLMLIPEWSRFQFKISPGLWKRLISYGAPMIIIGLAGMVNEVMDRQFLDKWLPFTLDENKRIVAIYGANYRLAIFITLFIQAFKMAAEPFFFNQAKEKNAPKLYARIMKWFVITLAIAFLFTALYLDVWEIIILRGPAYRTGVGIVPVLLLANICLGIYYNLSVWYKLTDRMMMGLYITLIGAGITFIGNYFFIPRLGMYASAWTTFICYLTMMILAYILGQKYFPIPYSVKKIITYLAVMLLFFFIKVVADHLTESTTHFYRIAIRLTVATILFLLYIRLIIFIEKKELKGMPVIGKYIK